jgi:hypothetical protein
MKRTIILLWLSCISIKLFAQSDVTKEHKDDIMDAYLLAMLELTKLNATIFYPGIKDTDNHMVGFFPIRDNKNYKCLYWRADPAPEIYATVYLNNVADISSARLDTTVRQFTDEEAELFRIYDAAYIDYMLNLDTSLIPKKSIVNFIPMITKLGKKVYVNFLADDVRRMLFGNEVIYTFDKEDGIVSRERPHKNGSEIFFTGLAGVSPKYGRWFHQHENIEGLSIADLATAFLYHTRFKGQKFLFKDRRFIFVMDVGVQPAIFIHTHASYDQLYPKNKGD